MRPDPAYAPTVLEIEPAVALSWSRRAGRFLRRHPAATLFGFAGLILFATVVSASVDSRRKNEERRQHKEADLALDEWGQRFAQIDSISQRQRPEFIRSTQERWASERRPYRLIDADLKATGLVEHRYFDVVVDDSGDRMKVRNAARQIYDEARRDINGYPAAKYRLIIIRCYARREDFDSPSKLRYLVNSGDAERPLPEWANTQRSWQDTGGLPEDDEPAA